MSDASKRRGLSSWLTSSSERVALLDPSETVRTTVEGELRPPLVGHECVTERFTDMGEIGRGGMNSVRRVFDKFLLREAALKVLEPNIEPGDYRARRFLEEARVTGQLEHPNIVPIHELGTDDDGVLYFSMKLVQGQTLEQRIQSAGDRRLDAEVLADLLQVMIKVCEAVAYAHSKGVVHRDLKPANIMVGEFGQVYLMDWGIARVTGEAETSVRLSRANTPTPEDDGDAPPPDTIVGTPRYMAPEQAEGRHDLIDERTDVFALGATLYQILTGRPPYRATSYYMVLVEATKCEIAPPEQVAGGPVPQGLARIALKAMSRNHAERYQTVSEMQREIEAFARGSWHLPTRFYPAGTRIVAQDELREEAYILAEGRCEVLRYVDGQRIVVRELGPGEVFGELAILTRKPRNAHVDAITDCRLMVVTRDTLEEAIGLNSWVGRFVRALAERFRDLDGELQSLEAERIRSSAPPGQLAE